MAYSKIWFHTGAPCHGCSGISEHWKALNDAGIPFGVYSVAGGGLIAEAAQFQHATLIYRDLETDVAPYHLSARDGANQTWALLMARLPSEVKALKDRVWIEIGNEQDKTKADWLGWYYVRLAEIALEQGYRICGPGWSTGEPEPQDWETPGWLAYLLMCARHRDKLAVTVHEYSLQAHSLQADSPWLVGRLQFLFAACAKHNIPAPDVFVTELGWTHNDLPASPDAVSDSIEWVAELYARYPTVKAAFLWTLMGGGDKSRLAAELNATMSWLTDYAIHTRFPDVEEPLPPPPPVPAPLKNTSFEDGWLDSDKYSTTQNPAYWTVEWNTGSEFPNPHSQYHYEMGECVHKSKAMLPPSERDVFVWDGDWTLKTFAGGRNFWVRLKQAPTLEAGSYLLTVPIWCDCYRSGTQGKDYDVEPHQAEVRLKVAGVWVGDWSYLVAGRLNTRTFEFQHPGGIAEIAIHARCNWPINNNLWWDGLSLDRLDVVPPPSPGGYKAIIVKAPQDVSAFEWREIADYAYPFRHDMTASHDTMLALLAAGNKDSYVKVAYPSRQPDVVKLIEQSGHRWEPVLFMSDPFEGLVFGQPLDTPWVKTSNFDTPRDYSSLGGKPNDRHEGVDVAPTVTGVSRVLAVADGTVTAIRSTPGYGNYVIVSSEHRGTSYATWRAHLSSVSPLIDVGTKVKRGDVLGICGATGNATGRHDHLTMTSPVGVDGYIVPNVVDPTRFYPTPPTSANIDLLPYLRGDGTIYQMNVLWRGQNHGQQVQTQATQGGRFYLVKNNQWEELWSDAASIWRGADTSPGDGMYYVQRTNALEYGAVWCPRFWKVGGLAERNPLVTFYDSATGQKLDTPASGFRRTWLKFERHYGTYRPGDSPIAFNDVIELHWLPSQSGPWAEKYFYARDLGLVAWESSSGDRSWVTEVFGPGERQSMEREKVAGL